MRYDNTEYESASCAYVAVRSIKGLPAHGPYTKKQKKEIRRLIELYKGGMTEEQRNELESVDHIENVIAYLKLCNEKYNKINEEREQYTEYILEKLGAGEVLPHLECDTRIYMSGEQDARGREICIRCASSYSFEKILVLENVTTDHEFDYYWDDEDYWEISEGEGGYCLEYLHNRYDEKNKKLYVAYFTSARVENNIYNAMEAPAYWNFRSYLVLVAEQIWERISKCGMEANEKEKQLLPLIRLLGAWDADEKQEDLEELEGQFAGITKIYNQGNSIKERLEDSVENENLWKSVYDALAESQSHYPSKAESFCSKETLERVRGDIDTVIKKEGFEGAYPEYYKIDKEKKSTYYIRCQECYMDTWSVHFVCGGIKDGNDDREKVVEAPHREGEAYSCLLNDKKNRYGDIVDLEYADEQVWNYERPSVTQYTTVAVKKACKQRLSRAERKHPEFYQKKFSAISLIVMFIFMATMFGAFMTLTMLVLCTAVTLLFTWSWDIVIEMLAFMPWQKLFLWSGGLFAGSVIFGVIWVSIRKN